MKYLYLLCIVTFASLTSLRAQSLEGGFTILGGETVIPTEVQITAVGGQPFVGVTGTEQLGYGLLETISIANEQSETDAEGQPVKLTLDRATLSLIEGDNAQLIASYSAEVSNPLLRWSSSDETVATVIDGCVSALSQGNAVITVVSANGAIAAECTVMVQSSLDPDPEPDPEPIPDPVHVTDVTLDHYELSLVLGECHELKATVFPENADNKGIMWHSSDDTVAKVEDGSVRAISVGTATITVCTEDGGLTATCVITVTNPTGVETISDNQVHLTDGVLYIELSRVQPIQVISVNGKVLYDMQGSAGQNILYMQNYPAGIYFVRIERQVVRVVKR